jgi:hypothetical protein
MKIEIVKMQIIKWKWKIKQNLTLYFFNEIRDKNVYMMEFNLI